MNKLIVTVLAGCFISLSLLMPAHALEISDLDNPKIIEAFVDGLVLPLMKNHHSPSGTVALVKDGKLAFAKGYGYQDVEHHIPVDPNRTLFRPGSVSKLFTWVAVMQMVEQGRLDLDADINQYLKTFQIRDTYPGQPVTMRHIMTHTAGFEDGALGFLIIDDPSRIIPLVEAMKKYQVERVIPPGVQTAYSNYGVSLAGLMVANISGQDFAEYVQKNIFDVLGMGNSSFLEPLPEHLNKNMALAYDYGGGEYIEQPFEIISNSAPAGSLSATSVDMVKFAQAILNGGEYNGGRILKEATVKQMLTRNFSHDDRLMGMALGFYETTENGLRFVGHGGATLYFLSELVIDPANNMAFFLSFSGPGGATIVQSAFKGAFYDTFYPQAEKVFPIASGFSERADKYAGEYLFWRSSFTKLYKVLNLTGGISVRTTTDNTLLISVSGKENHYVEVEKNMFHEIDGSNRVAFQENEEGKITGLVMEMIPFMSTYKAPFYYTTSFNYLFLALSFLIFIGVMLRLAYQWAEFKALTGASKKVARAAVLAAGANILTVVLLAVVMIAVGDRMLSEIPGLFKLWLFLPIISALAGLYVLYSTVLVWKDGLCQGLLARIRYSAVAIAAIFMCWFYYFWNILGFNYFS